MIGLKMTCALERQYFFEGKLDDESRGELIIQFNNGKKYYFGNSGDGEETLIVNEIDSKDSFTEDKWDDYEWKVKNLFSDKELTALGEISNVKVEFIENNCTACRIMFSKEEYFSIWTRNPEAIFYEMNAEPDYYDYLEEKIELIDLKPATSNL